MLADVTTLTAVPKRVLLGRPLRNENLHDELLPKRIALPVFCSDPLSSNAYATEEILLVLSIGGLAMLHLTPWIASAVAVLLVVVVASYRQTCHAYPDGGGAYAVSRANLGRQAPAPLGRPRRTGRRPHRASRSAAWYPRRRRHDCHA